MCGYEDAERSDPEDADTLLVAYRGASNEPLRINRTAAGGITVTGGGLAEHLGLCRWANGNDIDALAEMLIAENAVSESAEGGEHPTHPRRSGRTRSA